MNKSRNEVNHTTDKLIQMLLEAIKINLLAV